MITNALYRIANDIDSIADSVEVEAGAHMRLHDEAMKLKNLATLVAESKRRENTLWQSICRVLKTKLW